MQPPTPSNTGAVGSDAPSGVSPHGPPLQQTHQQDQHTRFPGQHAALQQQHGGFHPAAPQHGHAALPVHRSSAVASHDAQAMHQVTQSHPMHANYSMLAPNNIYMAPVVHPDAALQQQHMQQQHALQLQRQHMQQQQMQFYHQHHMQQLQQQQMQQQQLAAEAAWRMQQGWPASSAQQAGHAAVPGGGGGMYASAPLSSAHPTSHHMQLSAFNGDHMHAPVPSASRLPRDISVQSILALGEGERPFPDSRLPRDDGATHTMFTEGGLKKYKGVTCDSRRRSQFRATLWLKGRNLHSPMVSSCVEAAALYDHMVRQHKGMGNQVNFRLFDDEIQFQPYESKRLKGRSDTEGGSHRSDGASSVGGSSAGGVHSTPAKRSRSDMSSASAREEASQRKAARTNTLDSVASGKSASSSRTRTPSSRRGRASSTPQAAAGPAPSTAEPVRLPPPKAAADVKPPAAANADGPVLPLTGVAAANATEEQVQAEVTAMAKDAGWPAPDGVPTDTAALQALQGRLEYLKGTYRGVYMVRPGRFRSSVTHRGKSWNTVSYPTAAAAAEAHDEMARKFKKRAEPMNFPQGDEVPYEPPQTLQQRVQAGVQGKWDKLLGAVRRKVAAASGGGKTPAESAEAPAPRSTPTRLRRRTKHRSRRGSTEAAATVTVEGHALTLEAAKAAGYITASGLRRQGDPQEAAALAHLTHITGGTGRCLSAVGQMGGLALSVPLGVFTAYGDLERVPWQRQEAYRHPANTEAMLHGFMLADDLGRDGHFSVCSACGRRGDLLMCDSCAAVYHPKCVPDVAKHGLPEGTWHCPLCQLRDGVMPALPLAAAADDKAYAAEATQALASALAPLAAVRQAVAAAEQDAKGESGDADGGGSTAAPASTATDDGDGDGDGDEDGDDSASQAGKEGGSGGGAAPVKWLGVYAVRGKFRCTVNSQGRRMHVGFFPTALAAARAYDKHVRTVGSGGGADATWAAGVQLNHADTPEGVAAAQKRFQQHARKMADRAARDAVSGATAPVDHTPWTSLSALQQAERAQRYATPAHALSLPSGALAAHGPAAQVSAKSTVDEFAVGAAYVGVTAVGSRAGASGKWGTALKRAVLNAGTPRSLLEGDNGSGAGDGAGLSYCTHVALPGSGKTLLVGQWRDAEKAALAFNAAAQRTGSSAGVWGANYVPGVGTGLVSVMPPFNAQVLAAPGAQAVHRARLEAVQARWKQREALQGPPAVHRLRAFRRAQLQAAAGQRGQAVAADGAVTKAMAPLTRQLLAPLWGAAGLLAASGSDAAGEADTGEEKAAVDGADGATADSAHGAAEPAAERDAVAHSSAVEGGATSPGATGAAAATSAGAAPASDQPSDSGQAGKPPAATESSAISAAEAGKRGSSSDALRLGDGLYNFAYTYKNVYGAGTASALYAAADALAHFEVVPRAMAGPRARQEEGVLLLAGAAAGEARRQGLSEALLADGDWVRRQCDVDSVQGGDTDADSWLSECDILAEEQDATGGGGGGGGGGSGGSAGGRGSPAWFRLGANEEPEHRRLAATYVESSDSSDDEELPDGDGGAARDAPPAKASLLGGGLTALTLTGDGPHEPAGWCVVFGDSSDSEPDDTAA